MFIDPNLAQNRLDDPSNILNSLFKKHTPRSDQSESITPAIVDETPVEIDSEDSSTPLTEKENDAALLSMLGLNPRAELPSTSTVLPYTRHGKTPNTKEMPDATKELIGTLGTLGNEQEVARTFNVVQSTVSDLVNGKRKKNPELKEKINQNIGKVVDKALEKLLCTVDSMDEHRIEQLSIKDAANVAAQMSKVVNNMNPKESPTQFQAGQLIIYAPAQYNENRYEVVELGQ